MTKKTLFTILVLLAALAGIFVFQRQSQESTGTIEGNNGFDRTSKIIYTKHAKCRMECRHIDEAEVREILERGRINHQKSDPASRPDPRYALEGITRDGQQVRIVFAQADNGAVVVTVIDLQKEWSCNCK
jgi:hypothetical protein